MGVYLDAATSVKRENPDYAGMLMSAVQKGRQRYGQTKFEQNLPNYDTYLQATQDPNLKHIYGDQGANELALEGLKTQGGYENALRVKMAGEPNPDLEEDKAYQQYLHTWDTIGPGLTGTPVPSKQEWRQLMMHDAPVAPTPGVPSVNPPTPKAPRPPGVHGKTSAEEVAIDKIIRTRAQRGEVISREEARRLIPSGG